MQEKRLAPSGCSKKSPFGLFGSVWGSEQRVKDKTLLDLVLDSKLRGCDLVSLRIGDIVTSGQERPLSFVLIGGQVSDYKATGVLMKLPART